MKALLAIVLAVAGTTGLALQPAHAGNWRLWTITLLPYALLAPVALVYLSRKEALKTTFALRGGDTSLGILSGMACVVSGLLFLKHVATPGTATFSWMFQIYAQVGPFQQNGALIALLVVTVCLEELVWRGLVLQALQERVGQAAIVVSAALYALAQAPTLLALRDPSAGLNPMVMVAALVMGSLWATIASVTGRLAPVALSHIVFTYFMAAPRPAWLDLW